jgi:hypothetical protein
MTRRVGDRHRAALRDAEQRKAFEIHRVHHRLEIAHPRVDAGFGKVPVGQPASSLVVAHELVIARELAQPVAPDRRVEVELEMIEPVGAFYQWRSGAQRCIRDARPVGSDTKANLLLHGKMMRVEGSITVTSVARRSVARVKRILLRARAETGQARDRGAHLERSSWPCRGATSS